ncbi:Partitioning defective 3-like B, partial [Ophiophagus hannah]
MYDEQDAFPKSDDNTNGSLTEGNSPDAFETDVAAQLAAFQPIGGEIEVTSSALKLAHILLQAFWEKKLRRQILKPYFEKHVAESKQKM